MQTTESRHTLTNGHYRSRQRPPDVFERLFAVVLLLAFVTSVALATAVTVGAVWAAIWFWQDIARRLAG